MTTDNFEWDEVADSNVTSTNEFRVVNVNGQDLLIIRRGDRYIAMDRWCPHQQADLAEGRIVGNALKCPLHGFMFSLVHGRGLNCPGFDVRMHDVEVEHDRLRIRMKP